jgi:hypothetical protein
MESSVSKGAEQSRPYAAQSSSPGVHRARDRQTSAYPPGAAYTSGPPTRTGHGGNARRGAPTSAGNTSSMVLMQRGSGMTSHRHYAPVLSRRSLGAGVPSPFVVTRR